MSAVIDDAVAVKARAVGERAASALRAGGGIAHSIEGFADAPYRLAANEVIWMGAQPRAMHPRMVVLDWFPHGPGKIVIDAEGLVPWTPTTHQTSPSHFAERVERELPRAIAGLEPRGFGHLLCDRELPFPLTLAARRIEAAAAARAARDPTTLVSSCIALLGVGTGLTPSGDDFVGGMLFALRLVDAPLHAAVIDAILDASASRTHVISAALLADAAHGATYSFLHDFSNQLSPDTARTLTTIGHSSGWDLLSGFALGATGKIK